jgi:hypothetical protein
LKGFYGYLVVVVYLDGLPKVISATLGRIRNVDSSASDQKNLSFDDLPIDFARGDVVVSGKCDVQVTLVISKIKVDFASVIQNIYFT